MIIRRHKNGTFSVTEMTRDDLDNLAFGACSAVAFYARNNSSLPGWDAERLSTFNRLENALRRVLPDYSSSAKRDSRVALVSDDFGADAYTEAAA